MRSFLERLPEHIREGVVRISTTVELEVSTVLAEKGEPLRYAYVPQGSLISLVSLADGRAGVELGMVGSETMLGSHLALGQARSPLRAVVQGAGEALRIDAAQLSTQMQLWPALQQQLFFCHAALSMQQATSAACLRFHHVEQRLARWLLMSSDRMGEVELPMTIEFLQYMLGVRRVGTSLASSSLLREEIISYRGGVVRIRDRVGLLRSACTCYARDNADLKLAFDPT